ncbi:hypothetical protein FS749_015273 [Ceratobasidium sp. UAMH 11750]|nr:hypothetical protein FS749_015273 [Ceratobasidium sp. UAMH 11750]
MPPRAVRNHPHSEGHSDRDVFGRDDSNASSRSHSGALGATDNPVRASDGHRQRDEAGPSDRTEIHAHSNIPSADYPPGPHLGSTAPHNEYTSVSLPPLRLDNNTTAHSDPRPPHPRLPPIETQVAIHPPSAYSSNRPMALAPSSPMNTTSARASGAQQARTGTNSSSSYSASVLSHNRATTFTSSAPSSAPSSAFVRTQNSANPEQGPPQTRAHPGSSGPPTRQTSNTAGHAKVDSTPAGDTYTFTTPLTVADYERSMPPPPPPTRGREVAGQSQPHASTSSSAASHGERRDSAPAASSSSHGITTTHTRYGELPIHIDDSDPLDHHHDPGPGTGELGGDSDKEENPPSSRGRGNASTTSSRSKAKIARPGGNVIITSEALRSF